MFSEVVLGIKSLRTTDLRDLILGCTENTTAFEKIGKKIKLLNRKRKYGSMC